MTNERTIDHPLNSFEQTSVAGFLVLLLFSVPVFGAGLFMGALLGIGLYLTRRTDDFSYLANTTRVLRGLLAIAATASMVAGAYWAKQSHDMFGHIGGDARDTFAFCIGAAVFLIAFEALFVRPLKRHSEWVAAHGIFATKAKVPQPTAAADPYAANSPLSAADEMLKWAKLKDAGHITEEQYEAERARILNRS